MVSAAELYDLGAEAGLLTACMLSAAALDNARQIIVPSDFHKPQHGDIWSAMCTLRSEGVRIDAVTIADRLLGLVDPALVVQIQNNPDVSISGAGRYTEIIVDFSARRRLVHISHELSKAAVESDASTARDSAAQLIAGVEIPTVVGAPSRDLDEFLGDEDDAYDWLVPGLLERGDRLLVTGGEGAGKSMFLRQMAMMLAAGIHPFRLTPVEPVNVTLIDLENGERLIKRELRYVRRRAGVNIDPRRLRVESRPSGMDITSRAMLAWLKGRVKANEADALVMGPIYKLQPPADNRRDGSGGEAAALRVSQALDSIRDMGVTLILETHAPHGNGFGRDMRPFGSSVWLRWPEFGYGLLKDPDVKGKFTWSGFRGDRDGPRDWPVALHDGRYSATKSRWPWTAEMAGPAREVA